ncbi:hypothetical protein HanIR_Chr03g0129761 [Helianthus annuus]|nr:hypothetical protein HanIR_Chr03g0129761 [Helianthus annuus]
MFSLLNRLIYMVFDPRGCTSGFSCMGTLGNHQGSPTDLVGMILFNQSPYKRALVCNIFDIHLKIIPTEFLELSGPQASFLKSQIRVKDHYLGAQ